jgi:5-methylcytosine-specific restriction enzyme A
MATEDDLHEQMLSLHQRTGRATGYWPGRFLQAVRNRGGLDYAKSLLQAGGASEGFKKLVAARRADLSVEYLALSAPFAHLFEAAELAEARARLEALPASAFPQKADSLFPDELDVANGADFPEGAVERIAVNRYERNSKARDLCIQLRGSRCTVCKLDFEERYGELGRGFIHVHHVRPLAGPGAKKRVDPREDLVPVCPNCHAMLHRTDPPMDVEELSLRLVSL